MHCRLQVFAGRGLSAASRIRRTEPANQRPALRLHGASKQAAHVEGGEGDGRRAGMPADATRQQQHDHGPAAAFVAAQLIACRAEPAAPEWGELRQVTVAQCSSSGRCCCWHARLLACTAATAVMAPDASRGMAGQLFCVHPAWPPACIATCQRTWSEWRVAVAVGHADRSSCARESTLVRRTASGQRVKMLAAGRLA